MAACSGSSIVVMDSDVLLSRIHLTDETLLFKDVELRLHIRAFHDPIELRVLLLHINFASFVLLFHGLIESSRLSVAFIGHLALPLRVNVKISGTLGVGVGNLGRAGVELL